MARHPERHSARHAAPRTSSASRALLRAGLTVSVAGAALGLGGAAASAAPAEVPAPGVATPLGDVDPAPAGNALLDGVQRAAGGSLHPVKNLKLNPLAGTGVDPLDNAVGTQVADFKPVSTGMVTGPFTQGSLSEMPGVGVVAGALPG
ncbi:hypothetical protein GCM10010252_05620 [Streptomyces aureoverticillatus]|nr:hypothetical protein GCM10010252_05620 [Streptomyces aureoverticillatus]